MVEWADKGRAFPRLLEGIKLSDYLRHRKVPHKVYAMDVKGVFVEVMAR